MDVFAWLATPQGQGIAHAVEAVLIGLGALLSAWAGSVATKNQRLLNGHLRDHMLKRQVGQRGRPKADD